MSLYQLRPWQMVLHDNECAELPVLKKWQYKIVSSDDGALESWSKDNTELDRPSISV